MLPPPQQLVISPVQHPPPREALRSLGFPTDDMMDTKYFDQAFTHPSYSSDHGIPFDFESLEWLGDSVLGQIVSVFLWQHFGNDLSPGKLTVFRSRLVNSKALASVSQSLGIPKMVRMGAEGIDRKWAELSSKLAEDAFEAVIGASYLTFGLAFTKKWVHNNYLSKIDIETLDKNSNFKELLSCYCQKNGLQFPTYETSERDFRGCHQCTVFIQDHYRHVVGSGCGRSKRDAQQNAARNWLDRMRLLPHNAAPPPPPPFLPS